MAERRKVMIALSGGLDSAVLLGQALDEKFDDSGLPANEVTVVNFSYGSKHGRFETICATKIAEHYGVPLKLVSLRDAFDSIQSSLLMKSDAPIPEGHYEEESMRQTVVPFRNGIFLSVLAGMAESLGISEIRIGAHVGDHFIYPDCRPKFMAPMALAIKTGTDGKVNLKTPFSYADKKGIVAFGIEINTPFKFTRTCYKPQPVACGKCGSCQERLWAFKENGIEDPIEYVTREILPKSTPVEQSA